MSKIDEAAAFAFLEAEEAWESVPSSFLALSATG
jgi:hypothetical protein